jgi:hypothetical protein
MRTEQENSVRNVRIGSILKDTVAPVAASGLLVNAGANWVNGRKGLAIAEIGGAVGISTVRRINKAIRNAINTRTMTSIALNSGFQQGFEIGTQIGVNMSDAPHTDVIFNSHTSRDPISDASARIGERLGVDPVQVEDRLRNVRIPEVDTSSSADLVRDDRENVPDIEDED